MAREAQIVDALQREGFLTVNELSARFEVAPMTIRRDLARLAEMGVVQRTHGGAIPAPHADTPMRIKRSLRTEEKAAIGAAVAERLEEGQTVQHDSGTNTLEVARHLGAKRLTVVTNDLRIGLEVADGQTAHLVFLGGELLPSVYTMWGPSAVTAVSEMRVDVAVFGADALNNRWVFNQNSYEVELKRAMLESAREAHLVADSSKFGREALFPLFSLGHFACCWTDEGIDEARAALPIPLVAVPLKPPAPPEPPQSP
jgi:DeoR/GlpR family transcriptional regulator of sugar metabolism